jgi:hypothetical protein
MFITPLELLNDCIKAMWSEVVYRGQMVSRPLTVYLWIVDSFCLEIMVV